MPLQPALVPVVLGKSRRYTDKIRDLFGSSVVAYWPQSEPSGTVALDHSGNGRNGAYTGTTLGVAGIGDGLTAASFDGTTSFNNIHSASLAAAFNPLEGTLMAWAKVSGSGVWTDGASRMVGHFYVDANNRVFIGRQAVNNRIEVRYTAGGTLKQVLVDSLSSTGWMHWAVTWSAGSDQLKAYLNGAQTGSTQTGLGTWVGALDANTTAVGAFNTVATGAWSGSIAHAVLLNRVATPAEISIAAAIP